MNTPCVDDILDNGERAAKDYRAWLDMLKASAHMTITMKELAELIKAASKMHEESYVPNTKPELMTGYYTKTVSDCCSEVCRDKPHIEIILVLLTSWWNDANQWADAVLGVVDGTA